MEDTIRTRNVMICLDSKKKSMETLKWYIRHVHEPNDRVVVAFCPTIPIRHLLVHSLSVDFQNNAQASIDLSIEVLSTARKMNRMLIQSGIQGTVDIISDPKCSKAFLRHIQREQPQLIVVTGKRRALDADGVGSKPSLLSGLKQLVVGRKGWADYLSERCCFPVLVYKPTVCSAWSALEERCAATENRRRSRVTRSRSKYVPLGVIHEMENVKTATAA